MKDKILITSLKDITLSTAFVQFENHRTNTIGNFFNATELAKMFCETRIQATQKVKNYLKSNKAIELIKVIESITTTENAKIIFRNYKEQLSWKNGVWLSSYLFEYFCEFLMTIESFAKLKMLGRFDNVTKKIKAKSVYIGLFDDKTIKIGISKNPEKRLKNLTLQSGKYLINSIFTVKLEKSYEVEQKLLGFFDNYRTNGEWIKGVKFEMVVSKLMQFTESKILNDLVIEENKILSLP